MFCIALVFALQFIFCTSLWGVDNGDPFNNSLSTNTTESLPELNNTYQMGMQHMENGSTIGGTYGL